MTTSCHLSEYSLVCDSLKQDHVATVLSPAGGASADVISREAEGQQGTEAAVEKFNSVRPNSLDIFSPARDGQMMPSLPSHVFNKWNTLSLYFISNLSLFDRFLFFFKKTLGPRGQLEIRLEDHKVKKKPKFVQKSLLVLALMLSFWSSQFGDAAQRMWGSASHRSGQFGRFLPSQRRSDFSPLLLYNVLMWFLSSQIEPLSFRLSHRCQLPP